MRDLNETPNDPQELSMAEVEAEDAVSLPNKEVLSLLDVNANVDLGLDLAAPVDLAAAANLNVAAPIEAAASANVLSPGAEAVGMAHQSGTLDQTLSGEAHATAPQHAQISQNANSDGATAPADGTTAPGQPAPMPGETTGAAGTDASGVANVTGGAVDGATGAVDGATGGAVDGATGAVDGAAGAAGDAASSTTGGVDSLVNGGSLLDANVNVHANANLTAPIDGAVAANGNVAAPVDAAVGANIGSAGAVSEAVAPQELDIHQELDHVHADATATQDASVSQQ